MTTRNDRFADHTRSASFAVTLSQPMIGFLLECEALVWLCEKYPWHRDRLAVNFGDPAETVLEWGRTGTVSALARRGLVDIDIPNTMTMCRHEAITLTEAGRLMCGLLREAGFTADLPSNKKVHLHPDDRAVLRVGGPDGFETEGFPPDRRDPADADYLATPIRGATP